MKSMNPFCRPLKMLLLSCLLCSFTSLQAHQEKTYLFKGMLEKNEVIFKMVGHEDIWVASFFDTKTLEISYLPGEMRPSQSYIFNSAGDSAVVSKVKEKWNIDWYRGGKKIRSKLKFVDEVKSDTSHLFANRASHLRFHKVNESGHLIYLEEEHSGVIFFRLKGDGKVNETLQKLHEGYAFRKIDCYSETASCFEVTTEVSFYDNSYLSFSVRTAHDVNASNRTKHKEYYNYQVKTGRDLRLEDLVYFGQGDAPVYQSQDWFKYRYQLFPKRLIPFLKLEETCLKEETLWQFPNWYLKDNLIYFEPEKTKLKAGCETKTWFPVEIDRLLH